ncbi:hypothetical protein [Sinomonas mesophila]|uniref:hypothetical protein n=1 Tax=Sinomonas mesophila TaxID=1531955 RepID=UPI0011159E46|nr:hypothetical protein [Sinomonas mesophila]
MADEPKVTLGIENSSSMTWSAPERFREDLAELSRVQQHHIYFVVVGPKLVPTALSTSPDWLGWKLDFTYGTTDSTMPQTLRVPKTAFPESTLSFDPTKSLVLVPDSGGGQPRRVTVAEVAKAVIKAETWQVDALEGLFYFEVAYIGQSYGTDGSSKAIDRLTQGHKTVDKIFSDTQDLVDNRAVAFITIDQQLTSINAHFKTIQRGTDFSPTIRSMAKNWADVLADGPVSKATVDAAEAALITAFKPKWNELLKDFTQKDAPALVNKLKERGYSHLCIHIDLKDSYAKVKGPAKGIQSSHHTWTFNLDTGNLESPGSGSWQRRNTNF